MKGAPPRRFRQQGGGLYSRGMPMEAGAPNETVDDNRTEAIQHGYTPVTLGQEFVKHCPFSLFIGRAGADANA